MSQWLRTGEEDVDIHLMAYADDIFILVAGDMGEDRQTSVDMMMEEFDEYFLMLVCA